MGRRGQIGLLLWKNYLLQKRKVLVTLLEVGLPVVYALLLVDTRHLVGPHWNSRATVWKECDVSRLPNNTHMPRSLAFFPDTQQTRVLMAFVQSELKLLQVKGFRTEEEMVDFLLATNSSSGLPSFLGGVGFVQPAERGTFQGRVEFKIRLSAKPRFGQHEALLSFLDNHRWYTEMMFPVFQRAEPRAEHRTCGGNPDYYREGFLAVQTAVSRAFLKLLSPAHRKGMEAKTRMLIRRHPYPPYWVDDFVLVLQKQLPLLIILSFVMVVINIIKEVVQEKETRMKEYMRMMGLSSWQHWTAWFVKFLLLMAVSVLVMTILYSVEVGEHKKVLHWSDPTVFCVFMLAYLPALISFAFLVSVFFSRANLGAAAGGALYFCSYFPGVLLQFRYERLSWTAKMAACLDFNIAMTFGSQIIGLLEGTGAGAHWSNLNTAVSADDDFTLLHVLLMLMLDAVIYGLVAWYMEAVFPTEFGVRQPWYFPFLALCRNGGAPLDSAEELEADWMKYSQFFERSPGGARAGIKLVNLRKEFRSKDGPQVAVSGVTLDMLEGQITVLLGHNGAGKSSLISMLTGFLPPTSGTAIVNGFDIRKDLQSARSSLGLCPQHDVLFDNLTVEEHLIFFGKLKGLSSQRVAREARATLRKTGLLHKKSALAQTLSGGMKRRLSIGIALMGDPKVVILDEPSSGLDPDARRHIWTVLQNNQAGRTLLLTTHYMDEADVLGNRIAIMADGVVKCCGSSLFLKRKYGAGYHMVMVKEADCQVHRVTEVVQSFVPQAALESNVGAELSYVLPQESTAQFEGLFLKLQEEQQSLGISSFGASITTMEEVFLKASGEGQWGQRGRLRGGAVPGLEETSFTNCAPASQRLPDVPDLLVDPSCRTRRTPPQDAGLRRWRQQLFALVLKRALHTLRNVLVTSTQVVIPLVFTVLALTVIELFPKPQDSPPLKLSVQGLGHNFVAFSMPLNVSDQTKPLTDAYLRQFAGSDTVVRDVRKQPGFTADPDLQSYLVQQGEEGIGEYNTRWLVAAEFLPGQDNGTDVVAFFNNQAYHSAAISLAHAASALLQVFTGNENATLEVTNHPLPRAAEEKVADPVLTHVSVMLIALNVMLGMAFLSGTFALFLVRERTVKAKHLQVVSGVHPLTFWLATFLWDLVNFLLPCLLLLLTFLAFDIQPFLQDGNWAYILLLFFMYGWGMLPFVYLASFLFTVPSTAFAWIVVYNILSGPGAYMAVKILYIPEFQLGSAARLVERVFLWLLPSFCLGQGLSDFYVNHETLTVCRPVRPYCPLMPPSVSVPCCPGRCGNMCINTNENYLGWQPGGIGRMLVFLGVQGLVYFGAIFLLELRLPQRLQYLLRSCLGARQERPSLAHHQVALVQEDEDVARERSRLADTPLSELFLSDKLLLLEVSKWYNSFLAVERLSVGIPHGECFGLLGINGAGKTTTFQMLTGDETLSSGDVCLDGLSVSTHTRQVQQRLGYCPQFDALIEQLTGRETLFLYGRLRGVQEDALPDVVQGLVHSLLLTECADEQVRIYSAGNKRKLSTGIALVGDPPIVFLDEPTTGMDPVARRLLWNTLSAVRDSGRTLVLTSHNMEECEALCTRLAIMVNGQFRCLGSQQHLKSKFGQGYTLLARVAAPSQGSPDLQPLQAFMERTFPGSVLKDTHQCSVHFHITDASLSWAHIFGTLERAKTELGIEDYLVSQTTLEQVFIFFAQGQRPPAEPQPGLCCRVLPKLCPCRRNPSGYVQIMNDAYDDRD